MGRKYEPSRDKLKLLKIEVCSEEEPCKYMLYELSMCTKMKLLHIILKIER